MRVLASRVVPVLMALVVLLSVTVAGIGAQESTPVADEEGLALRADLPDELCSDEEIAKGDNEILEEPQSGAWVQPAATPGRELYLVIITLPPGSCVGYSSHYMHDGAIVWYVQEGEIEFAAQPVAGLPAANVQAASQGQPVTAAPIAISSGDWVTADRATEYTYRNAGTEPAVVLMTVNEKDPFGGFARACKGGCRKR